MDTCIFLFNLEHREEGHRIIREFLLGPVNIKTILDQDKRKHEFVHSRLYLSVCFYILFRTLNNPYDQLLYYHSAVCHHGLQRFLNRNPIYWCFVPQSSAEVKLDNDEYYLNMKKNKDNQSTTVNTFNVVKDSPKATTTSKSPFLFAPLLVDINRTTEETNRFVHNIPKPPNGYQFSQRQFDEQFLFFFDRKENQVGPSDYVDLYQYTVVAVCKLTLYLSLYPSLDVHCSSTRYMFTSSSSIY